MTAELTLDFSEPPAVPCEVHPSAKEIRFFRENGFLSVERITSDEEIDWLRHLYEHLFDPASPANLAKDRSGRRDPSVAGKLTQIFHPEAQFPALLRTHYFRNVRRYCAALLDLEAEGLECWSHMLRKAPGGRPAYWHQDEAFWPPECAFEAINAWLPMHDVSTEMGAMQFVPGSHLNGVLRHRHLDDPSENILTVDEEFDATSAVACPLSKGGCTLHHPATLHYTATNATSQPRLAFALTVQTPPWRRPVARSAAWMDEHYRATGIARQSHYFANGKVHALPLQ